MNDVSMTRINGFIELEMMLTDDLQQECFTEIFFVQYGVSSPSRQKNTCAQRKVT